MVYLTFWLTLDIQESCVFKLSFVMAAERSFLIDPFF